MVINNPMLASQIFINERQRTLYIYKHKDKEGISDTYAFMNG